MQTKITNNFFLNYKSPTNQTIVLYLFNKDQITNKQNK